MLKAPITIAADDKYCAIDLEFPWVKVKKF